MLRAHIKSLELEVGVKLKPINYVLSYFKLLLQLCGRESGLVQTRSSTVEIKCSEII